MVSTSEKGFELDSKDNGSVMSRLPAGEKFYEDYYREHPFDELGVALTAVAMGIIALALMGGLAISVLTRKHPANFEVRD